MIKFIGATAGFVIGVSVCIAVAWLLGHFFGPFYQGEDESTRNFNTFLLTLLISAIAGATSGWIISKKLINFYNH